MAQWINYDSVLAQITGYGIIVKGGLDVGTPRPVKCFVEGERKKRGWYRLYELTTKTGDTLIVGSYGIWRGNDPGTQKVRIDKDYAIIDSSHHKPMNCPLKTDGLNSFLVWISGYLKR